MLGTHRIALFGCEARRAHTTLPSIVQTSTVLAALLTRITEIRTDSVATTHWRIDTGVACSGAVAVRLTRAVGRVAVTALPAWIASAGLFGCVACTVSAAVLCRARTAANLAQRAAPCFHARTDPRVAITVSTAQAIATQSSVACCTFAEATVDRNLDAEDTRGFASIAHPIHQTIRRQRCLLAIDASQWRLAYIARSPIITVWCSRAVGYGAISSAPSVVAHANTSKGQTRAFSRAQQVVDSSRADALLTEWARPARLAHACRRRTRDAARSMAATCVLAKETMCARIRALAQFASTVARSGTRTLHVAVGSGEAAITNTIAGRRTLTAARTVHYTRAVSFAKAARPINIAYAPSHGIA